MNYEIELKNLKEKLQRASQMKVKAEATLENLEENKKSYLEQVKKLGIDPKNIESEISNLKTEIESLINEANNLLPKDI